MKTLKSLLAVILVIASLFTFAACGGGGSSSTTSDASDTSGTTSSGDSGRIYTKGSVIDGVYVNNWASLQFEITDEWPAGEKEDIKAYEATNITCGLVAGDITAGKQLAICFEKLPVVESTESSESAAESEVSVEEFTIDGYLDDIVVSYGAAVAESTVGEYRDVTVAGEKYRAVDVVVGESVYQTIAARKNGNYCIVLIATGDSKEVTEQALSLITAPSAE